MLTVEYFSLSAAAVGVYLVVASAFFMLSHTHPGLVEQRWWASSAVVGALGLVAVSLRGTISPFFSIAFANTALVACPVFSWVGGRVFFGNPSPWRRVSVGLALLFAINVASYAVLNAVTFRMSIGCFSCAGVAALSLRDINRERSPKQFDIYQALWMVTWFEAVALAVVGAMVWVLPDQRYSSPTRLHVLLPLVLAWTTMDFLLRNLAYIVLITRRFGDRAEQALRAQLESEARAGQLIAHMSAGVMVIHPDHTLEAANAAAQRFLDWSTNGAALTVAERNTWLFSQDALREDGSVMPREQRPFDQVVATGLPVADQVFGLRGGAKGQVRWALCSAYPVFHATGVLRHVVLTFNDITSFKQAQQRQMALEQQLAQSQKMEALGTLAGGVAHDFNNILAGILGNAHLAREELGATSAARTSVDQILLAGNRGRELVNQIQAFNRKQPMQRLPLSMNVSVKDACNLLRVALPSDAELVQHLASGHATLLGDATRIQQVLVNLGTNAVHALQGKPGCVTFQVEVIPFSDARVPAALSSAREGVVKVVVKDTGCGMDEATRERMFEPFFTTKESGSGTGLGLAVVAGMVEAHGGLIEVTSQVNVGTAFSIYFPALPGKPLPPTEIPTFADSGKSTLGVDTSEPSKAPYHVLYLDDDSSLVFLVRRLLERHGYQVTAFSSQTEAIEAVRAQPQAFDVMLTDYTMPGMSGIDVAQAVLAINPQLPVALTSAFITDELCVTAKALGVREVVFKTAAVAGFGDLVERLAKPVKSPTTPQLNLH